MISKESKSQIKYFSIRHHMNLYGLMCLVSMLSLSFYHRNQLKGNYWICFQFARICHGIYSFSFCFFMRNRKITNNSEVPFMVFDPTPFGCAYEKSLWHDFFYSSNAIILFLFIDNSTKKIIQHAKYIE